MEQTDQRDETPPTKPAVPVSLAEETLVNLRASIIDGTLTPGAALREAELSEQLGVSRNTLREAFRMLSHEGLITQVPFRGACVTVPTLTSIIDLYRVRRLVECQALAQAFPKHPAVKDLRAAVEAAHEARDRGDWRAVGTANVAFHDAIISLTDSVRLKRISQLLSAEMRLVFGLIDDEEYLYAPFLELNQELLELIEAGHTDRAAEMLDAYLVRAERMLLASYERSNPQ